MRLAPLAAALAGIAMAGAGLVLQHNDLLIWNRTGSAPIGLYRLSQAPLAPGRLVALSAESKAATWAFNRGYIGENWPLLKRVAALPGAEICRDNLEIFVDGKHVATALGADQVGQKMPVWRGCITLRENEIFLLNENPRSLDGRYFGATDINDVDGVAVPLFILSD